MPQGVVRPRPDGAQVVRFSAWVTVVPKVFLAESVASHISNAAAS